MRVQSPGSSAAAPLTLNAWGGSFQAPLPKLAGVASSHKPSRKSGSLPDASRTAGTLSGRLEATAHGAADEALPQAPASLEVLAAESALRETCRAWRCKEAESLESCRLRSQRAQGKNVPPVVLSNPMFKCQSGHERSGARRPQDVLPGASALLAALARTMLPQTGRSILGLRQAGSASLRDRLDRVRAHPRAGVLQSLGLAR